MGNEFEKEQEEEKKLYQYVSFLPKKYSTCITSFKYNCSAYFLYTNYINKLHLFKKFFKMAHIFIL